MHSAQCATLCALCKLCCFYCGIYLKNVVVQCCKVRQAQCLLYIVQCVKCRVCCTIVHCAQCAARQECIVHVQIVHCVHLAMYQLQYVLYSVHVHLPCAHFTVYNV